MVLGYHYISTTKHSNQRKSMPKVLNYNIFRLFRRNSKIGVMVLEIGCQLSVGRYAYTQYKLVPV